MRLETRGLRLVKTKFQASSFKLQVSKLKNLILIMRKKEQPIRGYKKVSAFIDDFITHQLSMEEAEDWVEDFFYTAEEEGIDVIPALLKRLKDADQNPNVIAAVAFMLEQYGDETVVEPVLELFKSPAISDSTRSTLLSVLDYYDVDTQDPVLLSYFQDIERLGQTALEGMLELSEQEEMLETLVQGTSNFPKEAQLMMIAEFGKSRDERALPLLGVLAEHQDKELADAAIVQLGSIRSSKSIEILENLINHREDSQELIERSLRKLQFAGITKEETPASVFPVYKCIISWADGRGSRIMMIARQKNTRHVVVSNLMLNEKVGIKDCYGAPELPLKEFDKMAKEVKNQLGGIEVEYPYCVQLIRDALWVVVKNKVTLSPLFSFHRRIFGNDALTPQAYEVDLISFGLEEVRQHLETLLSHSDELLSEPPFSDWWPDIPSSYNFVQKKKRLLRKGRRNPKILQEFLIQVLEPQRDYIVRRLELTIDFLGKKNLKAYQGHIQKALALWIVLKEQNQPLERIPFMRELAVITLDRVFRNIQMGCTEPEDYVPES